MNELKGLSKLSHQIDESMISLSMLAHVELISLLYGKMLAQMGMSWCSSYVIFLKFISIVCKLLKLWFLVDRRVESNKANHGLEWSCIWALRYERVVVTPKVVAIQHGTLRSLRKLYALKWWPNASPIG